MSRIIRTATPDKLTASDRARLAAPIAGPRNRLPLVRVLKWTGWVVAGIIAAHHAAAFVQVVA